MGFHPSRPGDGKPVDAIVSGILGRVQEFSQGEQSDDLTLLVARATP